MQIIFHNDFNYTFIDEDIDYDISYGQQLLPYIKIIILGILGHLLSTLRF